jgi:hypothetical protein
MGVGGWKIFLVASTSDYHALDNDATLPFFRERSKCVNLFAICWDCCYTWRKLGVENGNTPIHDLELV